MITQYNFMPFSLLCVVWGTALSSGHFAGNHDITDPLIFGFSVQSCSSDDNNVNCLSEAGYIFKNIDVQSCINECKHRRLCRYINYHFRATLCYLIQTEENITASAIADPGYAFGEKLLWNLTENENCNSCSDAEVCTGDPLQCQINECRSPDRVFYQPYSYAVGNLYSVGKRKVFLCEDSHFLVIYSTNIIQCLPDGSWTQPNYTCEEVDECLSNPCQNGGACNDLLSMYSCTCVPGYTGYHCETDTNECDSNPCLNGGQCSDLVNAFSCTCVAGYTGNRCQTDIDECASSPCQNGGQCNDLVNEYSCTCASGYTGNSCQTEIDECASNPCENGGQCTDLVNGYSCACVAGYSGNRCQTEINECNSSPCLNGGQCSDQVHAFSCSCVAGYTGNRCQTDIDECASSPCQNGGQCNDLVNEYSCTCTSGYTGTSCQTETDECGSNPCQNGGQCNDLVDGYSCTCASGYTGNRCQTALTCSIGWTMLGRSCYKLESTRKPHSEAKTEGALKGAKTFRGLVCKSSNTGQVLIRTSQCANVGGHLAFVTSQSEIEFLQSLYLLSHSSNDVDGIWISGTDSSTEGVWKFSDGTGMSYFYWHPGQPDNAISNDDCIMIWPNKDFMWNDVYCGYAYWFICETEL